ncbi:MAG: 23S rRNA (adenine(2030)-N(6))-methyltransferase RlmJ [Hyphomicrobiaceae bacterium]|nr:23S rRNA (adenine(2030)-N(6))-methyltransferase RlmJ [Hyphomicrobiaceae bacterium]
MNYRHAYHAGNFADVHKHAVLALVLAHLSAKVTPFRVVDTHAGIGRYDLAAVEAEKTGEWTAGIGRLLGEDSAPIPDEITPLLAAYLDAVRAENADGVLRWYPGSPRIARSLLRPDDRLIAVELHPEDTQALAAEFRRDRQVKVLAIDAWHALKSLLPPKERRGLVLIDPPYESTTEVDDTFAGLRAGLRRFANGIFMLWYPIKATASALDMQARLAQLEVDKLLISELVVRRPDGDGRLHGSGLALVNPPFQLRAQLDVLLPFLAARLSQGKGATHRLEARM